MRIKKIELVGFKSFKDRTVIQFDAGITGIVGPNGCGKSNIVDALMWVMGEMSAKDLRGSTMTDVIFAGADGYAPLGMCEVSLTLENDGGPFPAKYIKNKNIDIANNIFLFNFITFNSVVRATVNNLSMKHLLVFVKNGFIAPHRHSYCS